jgi:catechol 2,3-dioxygenase-like lactoylglutathione lyase family enzyme
VSTEVDVSFDGVRTIGQIHVSVSDIDRSIAFYHDALGARFLFDVPGQSMAFFDLDGVRLYLGTPESPEFRSTPLVTSASRTSTKRTRRCASAASSSSTRPTSSIGPGETELWMAFFHDPDGTNLAIMCERPAASNVRSPGR